MNKEFQQKETPSISLQPWSSFHAHLERTLRGNSCTRLEKLVKKTRRSTKTTSSKSTLTSNSAPWSGSCTSFSPFKSPTSFVCLFSLCTLSLTIDGWWQLTSPYFWPEKSFSSRVYAFKLIKLKTPASGTFSVSGISSTTLTWSWWSRIWLVTKLSPILWWPFSRGSTSSST